MGKIIAIAAPKGKVGKSTTALNLSTALALLGNRTMLIDLDPAGACVAGLGFGKKEAVEDIFNQKEIINSFRPYLRKTEIINLELLRIRRLPHIKKDDLEETKHDEQILRKILRPDLSFYDYIIMDCPPLLERTLNACLIAADSVLTPIVLAKFSNAVIGRIIAKVDFIREKYNPELKIAGILFTMFEKDNENTIAFKSELIENYKQYILNTIIPKSPVVRDAFNNKKPVIIHDPDDEATKAYRKLAKELSERKISFNIGMLR